MRTNRLGLMAAALMVASGTALGYNDPRSQREREIDDWGMPKREPEDRGRRAEKDAEAQRKAEEKRARKAAKRLKNMPSNDRANRRTAASSPGVRLDDGLGTAVPQAPTFGGENNGA